MGLSAVMTQGNPESEVNLSVYMIHGICFGTNPLTSRPVSKTTKIIISMNFGQTYEAQRAQSVDYTILYYQVREFAFCEPSCFLLRFSCLYNV